MIRKNYFFATLLCLVMSAFALTSCDSDDQVVPEVEKVFEVDQKELLFNYVGQELQIKATLDGEEVKATFSATPENTIQVLEDGKVKLLKPGEGTITVKYGKYVATVTFKSDLLYFLPYLRMFDGKEQIIAYEESLGHTLVAEESSDEYGVYTFSTNSKLMPKVTYSVGQAIQIFTSEEVANSQGLKDFLAANGFSTTGEVTYGYYMPFTSTREIVKCWVNAHEVTNYQITPGLCFLIQNPKIKSLAYPKLDWNANSTQVKDFETGRGYTQNVVRDLTGGRKLHVYTSKTEKEEFTEYSLIYYFFDSKDKLIKAVSVIIPAQYVLQPMGDAFSVLDTFKSYIKENGYTIGKIANTSTNLYSNEAADNKFTLHVWNIKLGGSSYVGAGLEFVPFNGPDEIDIDLN